MLVKMPRKGHPHSLLVWMHSGTANLEDNMEFPQKGKNRTPLRHSHYTARMYPKNTKIQIRKKNTDSKGHMHPHIYYSSPINIAKLWKESKCPWRVGWIKKMWYIYTMEYYAAIQKKDILPSAMVWVELECIRISKFSHPEKDKWIPSYVEFRKQNRWA